MSEVYNGDSAGVSYLVDGYMDYAQEIIAKRAISDLRDGLKPVTRRIIYTAYNNKKSYMQKCVVIVADALKLHPHGDSSVYGAFTLLTDVNGTNNVPVFKGMGNLGHVYSSNPPAAMRYPKAMLNENAQDFFNEKNIMELVPAEEGEGEEPKVLYVNYPAVLVNGTTGIAVGVGTRLPDFNFKDVCELTIKYIENGKLEPTDIIIPDFPTGGILVRNDAELAKIMTTGLGKLKIRAKVEINGKEIIVDEVPFGKTFEGIAKQIKDAEIKEISNVMNLTDRNSNGRLSIVCKSKRVVQYVLMELYRKNILQNTFASNMLVTMDGEPMILGVHGIINKWVAWRRQVVVKKFHTELANMAAELTTLSYFIRLISNPKWRDTYVSKATKVSKKEADVYLHEIFDDIPDDTCTWINGRAISAFNNGGKYQNRYDALLGAKVEYEGYEKDPDSYIVKELKELIAEKSKAGWCTRHTVATYKDYKFSKLSDTEGIVDDSFCVYTLMKDGFLRKTREDEHLENALCTFEGQANSVLAGFDNFGRVIRLNGSEIEFTAIDEKGTYLPKLLDATFEPKYKVLYLGLCDNTQRMLLYRDGFVGFFDTSEWEGKKVVKVIGNGVCTAVMDQLMEVIEQKDIPDCLLVVDNDSKNYPRFGWVNTSDIPVRSRTSRARVFSGDDLDIRYWCGKDALHTKAYIKNVESYYAKLKRIHWEDFYGDTEDLHTGRYVDLNMELPEGSESN